MGGGSIEDDNEDVMTEKEYDQYKDQCVEEISAVQKTFVKLYDLNSYEQWFFDDDFGVFHFQSHDGRNLYFRYAIVGSFSRNTNTWKWSWDNENHKTSSRKGIDKVKVFGEQNDVPRLTTGLISGDEYTGWEMTAVAAKVLNAIGMYRFVQEHLEYYHIFTGELTKDEYDKLQENALVCEDHGAARAAFVCQHLNKDTYTGFHEAFESNPLIEPEDDYQAWCDKCERERLKEGEWNERSEKFAKIRLICDQCFFEIKRNNTL